MVSFREKIFSNQALMAEVKADVDRQRAEVARLEADEDFPALLDKVREKQQATAD